MIKALTCAALLLSVSVRAETLTGVWSGDHMVATFTDTGATFEQDCAGGALTGKVNLNRKRRFAYRGGYQTYGAGPQREDDSGMPPAMFTGAVSGDTLLLTIRPLHETTAHAYRLKRGARIKLLRCY